MGLATTPAYDRPDPTDEKPPPDLNPETGTTRPLLDPETQTLLKGWQNDGQVTGRRVESTTRQNACFQSPVGELIGGGRLRPARWFSSSTAMGGWC